MISGTRPRHLRCRRCCHPRHGVVSEGSRDDLPDVRPASLHTEDCCGRICQARNMLPMVCANTMRPAKGHAGGSRCRLRRPVRGTSELFFGLNCPPGNSTRGPRRLDGVVETCERVERTPPLLHRPGGRRQQYDHVESQPVILLRPRNCSASLRQPPRFRVRLPGKPTYAAMGGGHRLIRLVDGNV